MYAKELVVQFDELSEETSIGDDTPVLFHSTNSLHEGQVLLQHQVSQDQGGRAAHSYVTVHQHFASSAESPVDKVCCCLEVDAHVKVTGITSVYAHIGDLHGVIDVWLPSAVTVGCVQDVSDSMLE